MRKDEFPFLALVEHTNYMDASHYGGDHLLYLGDYLPATHRYFKMTQGRAGGHLLPQPDASSTRPSTAHGCARPGCTARRTPSLSSSSTTHATSRPWRRPIPNLYFASMAQVYPWDRGTNYAVELGKRVAAAVLGSLVAA